MFRVGDVVKMQEKYLFLHSVIMDEDSSEIRARVIAQRPDGTYLSQIIEGETKLSSEEGLLIVTEKVFELAE